jgi:cytochrome P450 family 135
MRWVEGPAQFLLSLREHYGDIFTIHLLQEQPWVVVSDPETVREVFTAPPDVLHAGEPKRILEPLLGPESILLNDGDRHLRQRRVLLPPFHGARLGHYEEAMRAVAVREIERWPTGVAAPAAPRTSAIALEVILRTVFGLAEEGDLPALRRALTDLTEYLSGNARAALVALGDPARLRESRFAEFRRLLLQADELVVAEIVRRRAAPDRDQRDDVLSLLLQARHDDGAPMSERELRDELMSLLIAGYETTATSLAWALERLARHPEALTRTVAEAPDGGGPYTDAAIQETLRIRPVFMHLARRVNKPFTVRGYELSEGVTVAVAIPLVHRDPGIYPDPDAFLPERFLESPPGTYTWIPFGGGIRRCIGAGFSLLEMRAVLSTLLERFTVRVASTEPERAKRRLLVMAPAAGADVILEPR